MKIKYIIDTPYEGKLTITDTDTGYGRTITKEQAISAVSKHKHECFISAKADFALRSVDQKEIFPSTLDALASL
jgi:hypothetical protein